MPANATMNYEEATSMVLAAARSIVDSFTTPTGAFIHDDLTETEWRDLRDAFALLDRAAEDAN